MTDKQIIGGRGSAKSFTTLNTVDVLLENQKLKETLKAKEQECEELKEEKQGLIKDWEEKKNLAYEIACKNEKLKQTLTEIKEIAEICINQDICTFCDYSDKCYIEDEEIPTYDVCKLILQKISECEVE